jgi:hypothetical protein
MAIWVISVRKNQGLSVLELMGNESAGDDSRLMQKGSVKVGYYDFTIKVP